MPKLPDKVDDWTPPWKKGELDEDKAAGLVFNLEKNLEKEKEAKSVAKRELAEAQATVATLEAQASGKPKEDGDKDIKISELTAELAKLKKDGRPEDRLLVEKYEVALEVGGLSLRDAKRLVGDDRDELTEDAKDLATRLAGAEQKDGETGEDGSHGGPSNRPVPRAGDLGNGRKRVGEDPAVKSVDELLKETPDTGPGLHLAPLTR